MNSEKVYATNVSVTYVCPVTNTSLTVNAKQHISVEVVGAGDYYGDPDQGAVCHISCSSCGKDHKIRLL